MAPSAVPMVLLALALSEDRSVRQEGNDGAGDERREKSRHDLLLLFLDVCSISLSAASFAVFAAAVPFAFGFSV